MKPYRGKRVEALNRIEEFKSMLARYVMHCIVHSSNVCYHVQCWLHFLRFERLDRLLCTRILKIRTRYHDSLWTNKFLFMRTWRSWTKSSKYQRKRDICLCICCVFMYSLGVHFCPTFTFVLISWYFSQRRTVVRLPDPS